MGLILDSSFVIAAERRGNTVEKLIEQVVALAGDQDAALSSVGLTELVHGIYRAQTPEMRLRRESFIEELLRDFTIPTPKRPPCWPERLTVNSRCKA